MTTKEAKKGLSGKGTGIMRAAGHERNETDEESRPARVPGAAGHPSDYERRPGGGSQGAGAAASSARAGLRERAEGAARLEAGARLGRHHAAALAPGDPVGARLARREADEAETRAAELLRPPAPLARGAGGEVRLAGGLERELGGLAAPVADPPDALDADASLHRLELLAGAGCVSLGLDAAGAAGARDGLERMLAHQLAAAHRLAMRFAAGAEHQLGQAADWRGRPRQQVHSTEAARLAGTSARMMAAFQQGLEALGRHRSGGRQQIVVQHVTVAGGGRAVVAGAVAAGGTGGRGEE